MLGETAGADERRLRVFISHTTADRERAENLSDLFSANNFQVRVQAGYLYPSENWQAQLDRAIHATDVLLLLASRHAFGVSNNVAGELEVVIDQLDARSAAATIIVGKLEPCDLPLRLRRWTAI